MINIDKEKCVACGACVRVCLQHVEQIKRALELLVANTAPSASNTIPLPKDIEEDLAKLKGKAPERYEIACEPTWVDM